MGAMSDAGDGVLAAVGKITVSKARPLSAAIADFAALEEKVAEAKRKFASRITDEFGAVDPGISEMLLRQAGVQARMAADTADVNGNFRRAHRHEWERIDAPRPGEAGFDVTQNQE